MKYLIAILFSFLLAGAVYASSPTVESATSFEGNGSDSLTTKTIAFTVASGQNKMLVVCVGNSSYTNITAATWNGDSMTAGTDWHSIVTMADVRCFYLANPDVGSYNLVVDFGSTAYIKIGVLDLTNANQGAPHLQTHQYTGGNTTFTETYTTTVDNVLIIQAVQGSGAYANNGYGAGQTQRWQLTTAVYEHNGNTKEQTSAGSSSSVVTSSASANYEGLIVAIQYEAPTAAASAPPNNDIIIFE